MNKNPYIGAVAILVLWSEVLVAEGCNFEKLDSLTDYEKKQQYSSEKLHMKKVCLTNNHRTVYYYGSAEKFSYGEVRSLYMDVGADIKFVGYSVSVDSSDAKEIWNEVAVVSSDISSRDMIKILNTKLGESIYRGLTYERLESMLDSYPWYKKIFDRKVKTIKNEFEKIEQDIPLLLIVVRKKSWSGVGRHDIEVELLFMWRDSWSVVLAIHSNGKFVLRSIEKTVL